MIRVTEKNNFLQLTIGIVILLFATAVSDQYSAYIGFQVVQAFTVINIVVGLYGFKSKKLWFHSTISLSLSIFLVVALAFFLEYLQLYYVQLGLLLCFYLWAIWLASKQVLFSGTVDINEIIGAICIYLLMGLIWALIYLFVAQSMPGAFNGVEQLVWHDNFSEIVYFSFVTLTTLGYGDISPVIPVARFLVYMEAVVGVFYMAILVASLIGARVEKNTPSKNNPDDYL